MFIDRRINYISRDDIKLDLEFVDVLAIEIPKDELHTKNSIIIISIYRPPSIQVKLFTDKFTDLLQFLSRENKYIFIVVKQGWFRRLLVGLVRGMCDRIS